MSKSTDLDRLCGMLLHELQQEFGAGLLGLLATGSRIHGIPGPASDLDAHVLIGAPQRQRRNFVLDGVEIELFINPPFQVRRYLADGRGHDAHMFVHGRAIYDPQGIVAQLQADARAIWEAGPAPFGAGGLWLPRYFAADMLRDLSDIGEDEAGATLQIARIVDQLIETHCRLCGRWSEKPKRRLADLQGWAPELAQLARAALACGPLPARRAAAQRMAERVLAPIDGLMPLEWHTEWELLEDNMGKRSDEETKVNG